MDEDRFEIEIGTRFSGLEEAREYARALRDVAGAQDEAGENADRTEEATRRLGDAMRRGMDAVRERIGGIYAPRGANAPGGFANVDPGANRHDPRRAPVPESTPAGASRPAGGQSDQGRIDWRQLADRMRSFPSASPDVSRLANLPSFGSASPISSRLTPAPGGGAMLAAAGAAVLGIKMLADASAEGARRIKEYADAAARPSQEIAAIRETSGGSLAESAALRSMGIDGGRARALTERIASDPFAKAAAGRLGVQALPGPYGTLDTARTTIDTIRRLRAIPDDAQAQRAARVMGAEDLLRFRRVSEQTFQNLRRDAELTARVNDPAQIARGAEYETSLSRLSQAFENAKVAASGPLLETMADLFNGIADTLNGITSFVEGNRDKIAAVTGFFESMALVGASTAGGGGLASLYAAMRARGESSRAREESRREASPQVDALNANTEALNRLTRNIGGGVRSRGALPEGLRDGRNLARAMNSGAMAFGPL